MGGAGIVARALVITLVNWQDSWRTRNVETRLNRWVSDYLGI